MTCDTESEAQVGASYRQGHVLGHAAIFGNDAEYDPVRRMVPCKDGVLMLVIPVTITVDLAHDTLSCGQHCS